MTTTGAPGTEQEAFLGIVSFGGQPDKAQDTQEKPRVQKELTGKTASGPLGLQTGLNLREPTV